MVKSSELVKRAIEFNNPSRVPRDLWCDPAVEMFRDDEIKKLKEKYEMDIEISAKVYEKSDRQKNSSLPAWNFTKATRGKRIDEWGSIRKAAEDGVTGEVVNPALEDFDNFKDFEPPWEFIESIDKEKVEKIYEDSEKFLLSPACAQPFERMQFLRGTENLFKDLIRNREKFIDLRDMVHDYTLKHIKKWLDTPVDGIWMMDDWGSQNNLLIDPADWRKLFKPLYRECCRLIHNYDKYIFFHSDGYIEDIYEDLIEVGMDAINSQLFIMDIENLAEKHKGEVTFWGEIDRQNLLPFGSPGHKKGRL